MNTLSSFLWNGDLNSPLMEVFTMDNNNNKKSTLCLKTIIIYDEVYFFRHRGLHYSRQSARSERYAEQQCHGHYVLHKPFVQG